MTAWWKIPLCDSGVRHSTETRKLSLFCGDSSIEGWLAFPLWPFVILLKYNWDTWEERFSLVDESQGILCAVVGEGRLRACHWTAFSSTLESFQVINGDQSGDNHSRASQNAIFWNGGLITWQEKNWMFYERSSFFSQCFVLIKNIWDGLQW